MSYTSEEEHQRWSTPIGRWQGFHLETSALPAPVLPLTAEQRKLLQRLFASMGGFRALGS